MFVADLRRPQQHIQTEFHDGCTSRTGDANLCPLFPESSPIFLPVDTALQGHPGILTRWRALSKFCAYLSEDRLLLLYYLQGSPTRRSEAEPLPASVIGGTFLCHGGDN